MRAWSGDTSPSARFKPDSQLLLSLLLILPCLCGVAAQTSNATCEQTDENEWMFNSDGESPCLVWSKIQSLCVSSESFINVPPLLDPSWSYNAPSEASSECYCNSVSYGLMAACTYCQWSNSSIPSEESWASGCQSYNSDGLGFAENVEDIPPFAYQTWSGAAWAAATVSSVTTGPSSTPSYSTTLSRSFPTSNNPFSSSSASTGDSLTTKTASSTSSASSSTATSSDSSSDDSEGKSSTPWGAIIGGVGGGVFGLILLFLFWRWYKNRNRISNPRSPFSSPHDGTAQKRTKKARVKYPLPPQSFRDSLAAGKNFLDMLVGGGSGIEEKGKRDTEMMNDPEAFSAPRKAPPAPRSQAGSGLAWKTRSKSLRDEDWSQSDQEYDENADRRGTKRITWVEAFLPSARAEKREREKEDMRYTTTSQRLARNTLTPSEMMEEESEAGMESARGDSPTLPVRARYPLPPAPPPPAHIPPPAPDQLPLDFSQAPSRHPSLRPVSGNTLPSLYEPPTGARTYRGSTMYSPASRYPGNAETMFEVHDRGRERPMSESTIGAALNSASVHGGGGWGRDSAPPLPTPHGDLR
ncbi:hypothetical protein L198_05764 [Cryptococcus wingfieldii CBS 7118]|uniref:Uncharacterized protein n=1 Tax=Cryptococcus wingfieldii CBS 7118 TaxID=1295528 RepID=A0A1E3IU48_9TREE|nr:hypothetical protein L198_05764 [Cryptococcus wingfieldii CBS 7118]ODN92092.1 hypothetical protein L198_05764 [Cryptococcus wingfieldii CBS 7118]